mmetsp:Transcript_7106/g.24619  ORF Transcript_7106/g.24619 Transcript_7106/m.24619 type:complete len:241 (-) Transcript_7106:475-1197(-)
MKENPARRRSPGRIGTRRGTRSCCAGCGGALKGVTGFGFASPPVKKSIPQVAWVSGLGFGISAHPLGPVPKHASDVLPLHHHARLQQQRIEPTGPNRRSVENVHCLPRLPMPRNRLEEPSDRGAADCVCVRALGGDGSGDLRHHDHMAGPKSGPFPLALGIMRRLQFWGSPLMRLRRVAYLPQAEALGRLPLRPKVQHVPLAPLEQREHQRHLGEQLRVRDNDVVLKDQECFQARDVRVA